jgi:SpoVK/Ycf46/Vps4 family AAA+-type ATPase
LEIINNNPYDENLEYNIDLKSLHAIKPELEELNHMVGLNSIKTSIIDQIFYFIQQLHVCTDKKNADFKHTVIYGPPGTGKTEIAKILGRMFSKLGVLKKSIFKKTTRPDFIAGFLGQTAIKTRDLIESCLGGVLFIDEAYSLATYNGETLDSYSKECLDTMCEALSDKKDDLMVIIAGYEDELNKTLFRANKGLKSRFIWRHKIEGYSGKELYEIFTKRVIETEWNFLVEIQQIWFDERKKYFIFYGRDMEILFSYTKIAHARNIFGKPVEQRKIITLDDLNGGFKMFIENNEKKEEKINDRYLGLYV